jgi:hypothetical protein
VDDLVNPFSCVYAFGVAIVVLIASALYSTGRRGKLFRALLISATIGIMVPLVLTFFYPYLFQPPLAPPPPPIEPNAPFLKQLVLGLGQAAAQGVGDKLAQMINPLVYGVLTMLLTFSLSFLIPNRGRPKATKLDFQ